MFLDERFYFWEEMFPNNLGKIIGARKKEWTSFAESVTLDFPPIRRTVEM